MSYVRKPIPYGKQHITDADVQAVTEALRSDFLTQGPRVAEFELGFSEYVGAKYGVAVANGTAALHLAILALGLKPGQKVITTPITFVASANCVLYAGGQVEFVDIDPDTFLIDLDQVEKKLAMASPGEYAGVIPVDFTGLPVDTERLRKIADHYGLWILEDACHAVGASFSDSHGQEVRCGDGRYADVTVFSFHPVKHIAMGEGGFIATSRADLHKRLHVLRTHGITKNPDFFEENHGGWYHEMQDLGYNYRLTDIQCALGTSQLKRAAEGLKRRRQIAKNYDEAFESVAQIRRQKVSAEVRDKNHAYHLYVVQIDDRKNIYDALQAQKIFVQVHYIPAYRMPYYKKFGWLPKNFPNTEHYYQSCLSLPMYPSLSDEEQDFVIKTFLNLVQR